MTQRQPTFSEYHDDRGNRWQVVVERTTVHGGDRDYWVREGVYNDYSGKWDHFPPTFGGTMTGPRTHRECWDHVERTIQRRQLRSPKRSDIYLEKE